MYYVVLLRSDVFECVYINERVATDVCVSRIVHVCVLCMGCMFCNRFGFVEWLDDLRVGLAT